MTLFDYRSGDFANFLLTLVSPIQKIYWYSEICRYDTLVFFLKQISDINRFYDRPEGVLEKCSKNIEKLLVFG